MISRTLLNIQSRLAQWTDVMRQLRTSVTPQDISGLIPWRYSFVTSVDQNNVVGAAAYFPTASLIGGKYNYLADIVVDSKCRSKGIGASMMKEILASNITCKLDSGLQRKEAHRFYEKLGFTSDKYVVRLKDDAFATIGNFPKQQTYSISGDEHLQKQDIKQQNSLQEFVDKYATFKIPYQANLQLFMDNNPGHHLFTLKGSTGEFEGIMLFELQNRLSMGGYCLHVSDLVVKDGAEATERQNSLLLSLVQGAKEINSTGSGSPIKSVIVEMTELEAKNHKLLDHDGTKGSTNLLEDKIVDSNTKKLNLNSLFSVTAKHFVKTAEKNKSTLESWYVEQKSRLTV